MSDHPIPRPVPGPGSLGQSEPPLRAAGGGDDPNEPTPDTLAAGPAEAAVPAGTAGGVGSTGHPEVDAVLASLTDLEGRPVAEHVSLFEDAHDRLRSALADAGHDPAGA